MKTTRWIGLAALVTAVAACGDSIAPDALDQLINEDAAMVAADAVLEDLVQMGIVVGAASIDGGMSMQAPHTMSRVVTFYDENGGEQDAYDPDLTASMHIVVEVSGAVEREGWSATIERVRDLTVSGLLGQEETRTWNGTGSGTISHSHHDDANGDRTYEMESSSVIADVVRAVHRFENPWPLSGTITRTISVTITNGPNGDETRSRTVVIEFNGTQYATMTVGDETFEVDLAAREGHRAHRRR